MAESVGDRDAMDLFGHSMQLGAHQESGIGYGYWLCQTLLETSTVENTYSINTRQAVAVACDALTWYTGEHYFFSIYHKMQLLYF